VYEGFRPLAPEDVADTIGYVVNLPEHVNILDLILLPHAAAQRLPDRPDRPVRSMAVTRGRRVSY